MGKKTMSLWSNDPRERLQTAKMLSPNEVVVHRSALVESSPIKPWPYGMPTTINPFLVILGPSPGNSRAKGDADSEPYEAPTVGNAHTGFFYPDTKKYWEKARELSAGLIQAYAPELTPEDCYALSGQMNLSVNESGQASKVNIEAEFAKWVIEVIANLLRPRLVVLLGLWGLINKNKEFFQDAFASSAAIRIDWKRPDRELTFRYYTDKRLVYRIWKLSRPDGGDMTIISWPNHPSRHPMTITAVWRASINEAVRYKPEL